MKEPLPLAQRQALARLLSDDRFAKPNRASPDGGWHEYGPRGLYSLDDYIGDSIDRFEIDRQSYWRKRRESSTVDDFVNEVAAALVCASEALVHGNPAAASEMIHPVAYKRRVRLFESTDLGEVSKHYAALDEQVRRSVDGHVAEHMQIYLAAFFLPSSEVMADRCRKLALLALDRPIPEKTAKYLSRLSRCYLMGFNTECLVLCRAVLESALDLALESCKVDVFDMTLARRIDHCAKLGLLSRAQQRDAHRIRLLGNKAVHEDPRPKSDVLDTIRSTLTIVSILLQA